MSVYYISNTEQKTKYRPHETLHNWSIFLMNIQEHTDLCQTGKIWDNKVYIMPYIVNKQYDWYIQHPWVLCCQLIKSIEYGTYIQPKLG